MTNVDALAPVDGAARPDSPAWARLERVAIDQLAERVRPTSLARDLRLPVLSVFERLIPEGGVRRGSTVAVGAQPGVAGARSLAFALAAGASQYGSWVAAVGLGSLGLVAASEMGVAPERLVLIAGAGRRGWPRTARLARRGGRPR